MRSARRRLVLAALAGTVLVSGCALRDARDSYAYGRTDGLWGADSDFLMDWRFPTTANQGPLLPPQRFVPGRPAIGVPWATGNPLVPRDADLAPPAEASSDPTATAHDETDDVATPVDQPASTTDDATPLARVDAARDPRARDGDTRR
jgi:hypothetical protein